MLPFLLFNAFLVCPFARLTAEAFYSVTTTPNTRLKDLILGSR